MSKIPENLINFIVDEINNGKFGEIVVELKGNSNKIDIVIEEKKELRERLKQRLRNVCEDIEYGKVSIYPLDNGDVKIVTKKRKRFETEKLPEKKNNYIKNQVRND